MFNFGNKKLKDTIEEQKDVISKQDCVISDQEKRIRRLEEELNKKIEPTVLTGDYEVFAKNINEQIENWVNTEKSRRKFLDVILSEVIQDSKDVTFASQVLNRISKEVK